MNITTERLLLAPLADEHTRAIFECFDEQVAKYMALRPAKDISETRKFVREYMALGQSGSDFVFAITRKDDAAFIGLASLLKIGSASPELGVWIKTQAQRKHYGREAIGGLINYARNLDIKNLSYRADKRNIASRKIPLFYQGKLVENKEITTSDGKTLELEVFVIEL